jgi:hypothetical protein
VFEDQAGKDTESVPDNGKGVLRCAVINRYFHNVQVKFKSQAANQVLKFNGASPGTCTVTAYRNLDRKKEDPVYVEAMPVVLVPKCQRDQEVFLTFPVVEKQKASGDYNSPKQWGEMRNIVELYKLSTGVANTRDCDNQGGNQMARDYLKAIGKAVSKLAGPLGAPLEGMLSLQEDDKKDKQNQEIKGLIESSKEISQQSVEAILQVGDSQKASHELLVKLSTYILEEMRRKPEAEPEAVAESVNKTLTLSVRPIGVVTEATIEEELEYLFQTDKASFIGIIENTGFPTSTINTDGAARNVYHQFVLKCRGKGWGQLCKTFNALYAKNESSSILKDAANIYCELAQPEHKQ